MRKDLGNYSNMSYDEEMDLSDRLRSGDMEAFELMVTEHKPLASIIAKRFVNRGLEFADLVQEGTIGLITAVKKYDPRRGTRFASFASYWIVQAIKHALASKSRNIRVPNNVYNEIVTYKIEVRDTVSMHGEGSERGLEEMFSFEEDFQSDHVSRLVGGLLTELSERERFILTRKFGLMGQPITTFVDMGKKLGISTERVRQINEEALEKIKSSAISLALDLYV